MLRCMNESESCGSEARADAEHETLYNALIHHDDIPMHMV